MISFSVLISLYFKENPVFLRESLNSVFAQTLLPTEVVLVEDGELTEELYQVVDDFKARYAQIKVVRLEQNHGLGKALNEGLRHCSYDLVARMDTDDINFPERFALQVAFMEAHPEIDVVGAWIDEFIDTPDNYKSTRKVAEQHDEIVKFGKRRNPTNHPVTMFRKSAVEAVGGYVPFYLFEDYYLWVRMIMGGKRFYNMQRSLLYFRFSPDMIKRRGGRKYALSEIAFQYRILRLGYINFATFLSNIAIRTYVRLIPNKIRKFIYNKMLR